MVDAAARTGGPGLMDRLRGRAPKQLELPLKVPGEARMKLAHHAKTFAQGFAPKIGTTLLMRVGLPVVAGATPAVVGVFAPDRRDDLTANLLVGAATGGVWGGAVGAALPFDGGGERIGRLSSAGRSAAAGVMLAPAVTVLTHYVGEWLAAPLTPDPTDPNPDQLPGTVPTDPAEAPTPAPILDPATAT